MKILWGDKDGGSESRVWVWGLESKLFGSILLMCFRKGSREAYHTHAFNAISWVLRGWLTGIVEGRVPAVPVPAVMATYPDFARAVPHG